MFKCNSKTEEFYREAHPRAAECEYSSEVGCVKGVQAGEWGCLPQGFLFLPDEKVLGTFSSVVIS